MTHENHAVCAECRRLFDLTTGSIVPGWEKARFVSAGGTRCLGCQTAPVLTEAK